MKELKTNLGLSDDLSVGLYEEGKDKFTITGKVDRIIRDRDGNIVEKMIGSNTVLNNGKLKLLLCLTGSASRISKCALGSGGYLTDPFTPVEVVATETSLKNPVFSKDVGSSANTSNGGSMSVMFSTLFLSSEVNNIVSEASMVMTDGSTFSRHTFPSVYLKDDRGFSMEVRWSFTIV